MLVLGALIFGFVSGFFFCAWMMGQKKSTNSQIIDPEWTKYKSPGKVDTWV